MAANSLQAMFLIAGGHVHKRHPWDGELTLVLVFIIIAMAAYHKIKNEILKWSIVTLASLAALGFIIRIIFNY